DSSRERPVESQETSQLGRGEIAYEKRVGVDPDRRLPPAPQVVFPESDGPARAILAKDPTDRERWVSRPGSELEIAEPDLPVSVEAGPGHQPPSRNPLMTG